MAHEGGVYRIVVKKPEEEWYVFAPLGERLLTVAVEADAVLQAGSKTDDYFGVACWDAEETGYTFAVWQDGYYAISRMDGAGETVFLAEGWGLAPEASSPGRHILGTCSGGGEEPVRLSLAVDGEEIALAADANGPESFDVVRLFAYSERGGSEVRFDNLVVSGQ